MSIQICEFAGPRHAMLTRYILTDAHSLLMIPDHLKGQVLRVRRTSPGADDEKSIFPCCFRRHTRLWWSVGVFLSNTVEQITAEILRTPNGPVVWIWLCPSAPRSNLAYKTTGHFWKDTATH